MFEEKLQRLSNADKRQFSEYVNDLMFTSFIIRKKFDRITGLSKFSQAYLFIEKYFDLFEEYVAYAGFELSKDDESGVIYIYSTSERNRIKFDSITTLMVYALRYYYEESLKSNSSSTEVMMDSVVLKMLIKDLGLNKSNKRISAASISNSLRILSTHNIIARAKHTFSDPYYSFYILPSIRFIIDSARMNALYNSIIGAEESINIIDEESENPLYGTINNVPSDEEEEQYEVEDEEEKLL